MKQHSASLRPVPAELGVKKPALLSHVATVLEAPVTVTVGGSPVAVLLPVDATAPLLRAITSLSISKTDRSDGMLSASRIFGSQPRIALRRDFCNRAALAREMPTQHSILAEWGAQADALYQRYVPGRWLAQKALVSKVLPCWRLTTVFTSGIINRTSTLQYHRDAGNFKEAWSAMFALTDGVTGGELIIPELDLAFRFTRPSLLLFNGAQLLHGVAPILARPGGYRYSVVYYALSQLCKCGTPEEELARIRRVKTEREGKRARGEKVERHG